MEAKFGPLEKRIKKICINRDEIFQKTSRYTFFDHKWNDEISEKVESRAIWRETKKMQIKLVTTSFARKVLRLSL
jgi:hypothetical protein